MAKSATIVRRSRIVSWPSACKTKTSIGSAVAIALSRKALLSGISRSRKILINSVIISANMSTKGSTRNGGGNLPGSVDINSSSKPVTQAVISLVLRFIDSPLSSPRVGGL